MPEPEKEAMERAQEDAREGKSPSTQAGEFVQQEMHNIREGKHGARSANQAIAIGLSEARRAGVKLPAPKQGKASPQVRRKAERDLQKGESSRGRKPSSGRRSRARRAALKRRPSGCNPAESQSAGTPVGPQARSDSSS